MLGNRERVCADRLPVPARDAGEAMSDVLHLDVLRGRVEQIESAAGQHALPGPRGRHECLCAVTVHAHPFGILNFACSAAHGSYR